MTNLRVTDDLIYCNFLDQCPAKKRKTRLDRFSILFANRLPRQAGKSAIKSRRKKYIRQTEKVNINL